MNTIKDLYENDGLGLREIARRTDLSFQTVQKHAYKEDWGNDNLPNIEPSSYPVLEAYIPTIDTEQYVTDLTATDPFAQLFT